LGFKISKSAYNFGGSGRNLAKLYQVMWLEAGVMTWTLILEGLPTTKFGRAKIDQNFARFFTMFDFDRKDFWNGST